MRRQFEHQGHVWGAADLIPADGEIFGFPTGWLSLESDPPAEAREQLLDWAHDSGCVLAGASVGASSLVTLQALQSVGFVCIDLALSVTLMNLKRRHRTIQSGTVRLAKAEDHAGMMEIAGTAFDFGRYHRDARFPRALADRRFAMWMEKSLRSPAPGARFYVMGPPGEPTAFMFAEIDGGRARGHLGGVSRTASNGLLGPMLFAGVLDALEAEGARSMTARISAANTAVLNIYSALGFHVSQPEFTLHHHLHHSAPLITHHP